MKSNLPALAICILILHFLVVPCFSNPVNSNASISGDTIIPGGFDPAKHVLLFLEMPKKNSTQKSESITKKLDKAVQKNWPYKYEIVSIDDINSKEGNYSDTAVYRYAILNNLSSYRGTRESHDPRFAGTGRIEQSTVSVTSIDFCFYDRVTGTKYEYSGKHSSFIGLTIGAFMNMIKKDKNLPLK
jgi:hypothetical protein